jgi:hypothetical protein
MCSKNAIKYFAIVCHPPCEKLIRHRAGIENVQTAFVRVLIEEESIAKREEKSDMRTQESRGNETNF